MRERDTIRDPPCPPRQKGERQRGEHVLEQHQVKDLLSAPRVHEFSRRGDLRPRLCERHDVIPCEVWDRATSAILLTHSTCEVESSAANMICATENETGRGSKREIERGKPRLCKEENDDQRYRIHKVLVHMAVGRRIHHHVDDSGESRQVGQEIHGSLLCV